MPQTPDYVPTPEEIERAAAAIRLAWAADKPVDSARHRPGPTGPNPRMRERIGRCRRAGRGPGDD